jgi:hypothetical protein
MKLTEIVQMKAIRCDNDCRGLRRGRKLEQRRKKEMANFGKLLMTQDQTWWGGDVSGSENGAVLACGASVI